MLGSVIGAGKRVVNKIYNTLAFIEIILYWGESDKK